MLSTDLALEKLAVRNFRTIIHLDIALKDSTRVLCLAGPNGGSKSSLLRLLAHALCQLTHESIPDLRNNDDDADNLFHLPVLLEDEVGDCGNSCCVRSDWILHNQRLVHHAFVRKRHEALDSFTKCLSTELECPTTPLRRMRWVRRPSAQDDPIARSVLLFRPSMRFERLLAEREGGQSLAGVLSDSQSTSLASLVVGLAAPPKGRRLLPVFTQCGLSGVANAVVSSTFEADVLSQAYQQKLVDAWHTLRRTREKLRVSLPTDLHDTIAFRVGIGRNATLASLSAGESDVLVTVAHIAAQQLFLRRKFGWTDSLEPCGWVFIDEVDLHLHPEWQSEVMPLLLRFFPNVRFVISTHSPFVLRSLPRNGAVVLRLPDGELFDDDFSAMNIEAISEIVFQVPPRWSESIEQRLDRLRVVVSDAAFHEEALAIYRELAERSPGLRTISDQIVATCGTYQLIETLGASFPHTPGDVQRRAPR